MAEHSRYNVAGDESGILKNKLGITDSKALGDTETLLLKDTYVYFFSLLQKEKLKFNAKLIFEIHKYFLGTLYGWAGKIRTVEISKDGILFCASLQIKKELKKFDKILKDNMPLFRDNRKIISEKLSIIHCEFNAIHPFREGNGRTIRLFLDLLAVNRGYGLIDYGKTFKRDYMEACVAGMQKSYAKMQKILFRGITNGVNR
ncbi:Fic family protein [Candidatus Peregrinibacteria bacterium]|nr:Fic family protein [Candidatus Peregrinibacteria bacterium]